MLKRIAAVLLAALGIFNLAGCFNLRNTTEQDKAFICGTVNGSVYESEFSGLKLNAPEGWEYSSEDELLELMELNPEDYEDDDERRQAELSLQKTIYDAMLMDSATGSNIIIMYENMSATVGGSLYTPEEYSDILQEEAETSNAYKSISEGTAEFCGEEYYSAVWETVNENDVTVRQCTLVRKVDENYMLCIALTYLPEEIELDYLKGLFEPLPQDSSETK